MNTEKIFTFDEFFPALFQVAIIKRQTPASVIELRLKLAIVCAVGVFILLLNYFMTLLKYDFQGLEGDLDEFWEYLATPVGSLMVFFRECTFIMKNTQIRDMLRSLEAIFPHKHEDQKCYHFKTYARQILRKNNTVKMLFLSGCSSMVCIPFFKSIYYWLTSDGGDYQFLYPFAIWNPFGNLSFLGYILFYCFQGVTICCSFYVYLKEDVVIATCVAQLCMHYRYLGETLSKLDARKDKGTNRELGRLIRHQYYLDRICNNINEIYSFSNFVAFSFTRIFMCLFLFTLINSKDLLKKLSFVLNILTLIASVYLKCSIGMELIDAGAYLHDSIYDQNWYEGTPKYRKTILIMLMKANRPMTLQAFKLKTISMEYFKEIVVSTYEIFMFIYNLTK